MLFYKIEVIKINYNNGEPFILPLEKLQLKSNRYYFKNTISLGLGIAVLNYLGLNIIDNFKKISRNLQNQYMLLNSNGYMEINYKYRFYIKDNGIEIDEKYIDTIFVTFNRIKDIEASGYGVGLTPVKKIIERNEGRIWVESKKGGRIYFLF